MTMSPESIFPLAKLPPRNPNLVDLEPSNNNFSGFKFPLDDPAFMLPADELFSNGKLIPLHLASVNSTASEVELPVPVRPQSSPKLRRNNEHSTKDPSLFSRRNNEHSTKDPSLFSPRAPKCSSRWKEILGLKRLNQREKENKKSTFSSTSTSIKSFLNRTSKSSLVDSSLNLPLLKDSDTESVSVSSSRMSLSSSSSSHEHDDLPRVSIDSDTKNSSTSTLPRISVARVGVSRNMVRKQSETSARVSVDSPRMNSSGKIVFHNLERSSSTPSSNCGGRYKNKGIERSYSAHVRITSVPVCSLRRSSKSGVVFGFPLFSSSQQSRHYLQQKNGNNSKKKVEKLMEAK